MMKQENAKKKCNVAGHRPYTGKKKKKKGTTSLNTNQNKFKIVVKVFVSAENK